jgi:hypothetical protein
MSNMNVRFCSIEAITHSNRGTAAACLRQSNWPWSATMPLIVPARCPFAALSMTTTAKGSPRPKRSPVHCPLLPACTWHKFHDYHAHGSALFAKATPLKFFATAAGARSIASHLVASKQVRHFG